MLSETTICLVVNQFFEDYRVYEMLEIRRRAI